jgi:hypothetical protein
LLEASSSLSTTPSSTNGYTCGLPYFQSALLLRLETCTKELSSYHPISLALMDSPLELRVRTVTLWSNLRPLGASTLGVISLTHQRHSIMCTTRLSTMDSIPQTDRWALPLLSLVCKLRFLLSQPAWLVIRRLFMIIRLSCRLLCSISGRRNLTVPPLRSLWWVLAIGPDIGNVVIDDHVFDENMFQDGWDFVVR